MFKRRASFKTMVKRSLARGAKAARDHKPKPAAEKGAGFRLRWWHWALGFASLATCANLATPPDMPVETVAAMSAPASPIAAARAIETTPAPAEPLQDADLEELAETDPEAYDEAVQAQPAATPDAFIAAVLTRRAIEGRVVSVADGDTITILGPGNVQHRIRLAGVDAPEDGQPWGRNARRVLSELVAGRDVHAYVETTDRFGRDVANVMVDGQDVSRALVTAGAAWHFVRYASDPALAGLERTARAARAGLWQMPPDQIVSPWDYRANRRAQTASAPPQGLVSTPSGDFECGKRRCTQMASCAEARFHLTQCGVTTLDNDGDGTPCESLCR